MSHSQASLPQTSLRIAAAQAQPVAGDVTANIARTVELTDLAAGLGAKLVVFPENFLSRVCGASAIWNPYGDVIAQAGRDRDEVITALRMCQAFVAQQPDMSGTRAAGKHQVIRYNGAGYPTGDLL